MTLYEMKRIDYEGPDEELKGAVGIAINCLAKGALEKVVTEDGYTFHKVTAADGTEYHFEFDESDANR